MGILQILVRLYSIVQKLPTISSDVNNYIQKGDWAGLIAYLTSLITPAPGQHATAPPETHGDLKNVVEDLKKVAKVAALLLAFLLFGQSSQAGPVENAQAAWAMAASQGGCPGGVCSIPQSNVQTYSYSWHFFADDSTQAALLCNGRQVGTYVFGKDGHEGRYHEKTGPSKWAHEHSKCPCTPPQACPVTGGDCSCSSCPCPAGCPGQQGIQTPPWGLPGDSGGCANGQCGQGYSADNGQNGSQGGRRHLFRGRRHGGGRRGGGCSSCGG